ncbi:MAG: VOC family protein [Acidimicrobiales bacterium]
MSVPPDHFGFTKLLVADLDTSAAFYRSVFGLQETGRIESEIAGRAIEEILFSPTGVGAATFVLLRYLDATRASDSEVILGFITSDIDALMQRALAAGGSIRRDAQDYSDLRVKVAFIADNEGHLLEVVQQFA